MDKSYFEVLAEKDKYITNPALKSKKIFPSFSFFLKYGPIILNCSKLGKRGLYNRYEWANTSLEIMHELEKAGVEFEITGMKNLTSFEGPAIFVANHMGTIETMVLPGIIQPVKRVVFVIKKELTTYPIFRHVINSRYPIVVERINPRHDLKTVMEEGAKTLESGKSIIIFAQKTRTDYFDQNEFNSLGIKLAKRNNVPVIPIALVTDAWSNGKVIKELSKIDPAKRVYFSFGEAMNVTGNGSEQHAKAIEFIESKFEQWGKLDHVIHSATKLQTK